jgi:formamidopyrimidine-DNA glycosylase
MPELPEVETMVRDLRLRLPGRRIRSTEVYWDRIIGYPDAESFASRIRNRRVATVDRRGKFALFRLEDGGVLAVHRGMTGSLLLRLPGEPEDRFVRARFHLDDGSEMRLDDSRKFGRLFLVDDEANEYRPPWTRLGVEPLDSSFTAATLAGRLAGRRAAIKTALLNQAIVAGIGNIYADEALFRARIHPERSAGTLSKREVGRLRTAITDVLMGAIEQRGTTFSTYRDVDGASGGNQRQLQVFHRHGQPCFRCGGEVKRIVLGARGTHFCPGCQRL